jgi:Mg-chelatase subunit ChlI
MTMFPFSAIVGQEAMKLALLLNAVNPRIGGVLIRGERGTAKSTAARGLAALLPPLPAGTAAPFVDLPVSATEDRVVGSLDLEAALSGGNRRFQPGLLAAADGGVLYVDEVNLLDDHLVDLLLDVAASGENIVEREGIAHRHPSRFILIGTMNPEEGELRPQLVDRFGLCVEVTAVAPVEERVAILERCLAFDRDPDGIHRTWAPAERERASSVAAAREAVDRVLVTSGDLRAVAGLACGLGVAGHRTEIVILRAACALAALEGREGVADADILRVAPMALRHRLAPDGDHDLLSAVPDALDLAARLESARGQSHPTEKKTAQVNR